MEFIIENLATIKIFVEIISITIVIIGGLYGLVVFVNNKMIAIRDNKEKKFIERHQQIKNIRASKTKECFHYYQDNFTCSESHALIIDKKWTSNDIVPLEQIQIEILDKFETTKIKNNIQKIKTKIIPKRNLNYADAILEYTNPKMFFNGDLYAVSDVVVNGDRISLKIYQTDYFNFINSCKILELLSNQEQKKIRSKYNVFELTNRHAGIGINCLTIFKNILDENDCLSDYFIIHKRTSNVIESPEVIHVVPAGSYSPITSLASFYEDNSDGCDFDKDLRNTIFREFCEEVFETSHMRELGSINLLLEDPNFYLLKYFTEVSYLGIGLEPFNTKMEILSTMVFDMKIDYQKRLKVLENNNAIPENIINILKSRLTEVYQPNFNLSNLHAFLGINKNDKIHEEGKIEIEKFTLGNIEQYYSEINITPSAKEIFGKVYKNFNHFKRKS